MTLRKAREYRNLTREDLLRRIPQISLSTLIRAEKGISCSLQTAREISLVLDMTIEEIFFSEKEKKEEKKINKKMLSQ